MSEEKTEKKIKKKETKKKLITAIGKRKLAVANAVAFPGKGIIRINGKLLDNFEPEIARLSIMESVILAGDAAKKFDINVSVKSGGVFGQADAVRQAISKIFVEADKSLRETFLKYDRSFLVSDVRRTEPHKPGSSSMGPRRHKQRSKR